MSALPKGDTGTATEDHSGERHGFLILELVFTLSHSISALDALKSSDAVFESAFLASSNCLLSLHFCTQKTTYYRAQNKQHSLFTWHKMLSRPDFSWRLWRVSWYFRVSQVPLLCWAPTWQQQQGSPEELTDLISSPPLLWGTHVPISLPPGSWEGFGLGLGAVMDLDMDKLANG